MPLPFPTVVIALDNMHDAIFDSIHFGITDPVDMPLAQLRLHHGLAVTNTVQTEMADVRFGGHEGHRHLITDFPITQILVHDEGKLVGRSEAGSALHRTDDNRSRRFNELDPAISRLLGVINVADGLGVRLRAKAGNLVKGQTRAARNNQMVIANGAAIFHFDMV